LANLASTIEYQFQLEIPVEHISTPSIQRPDGEILRLDTSSGWRDPIIAYLKDETLPNDKVEAQKLQHMATRYTLMGDFLYKKSYFKLHSAPYLRCLGPEEARRVIQEIHDGDCGNHAGDDPSPTKPLTRGYYWPKMFDDVQEHVRKCP